MKQKQALKTLTGDVVLDARKVAFLLDSETLLVADTHFEKGSYLRQYGRSMLPAVNIYYTIERLWASALEYMPKHIVALGDSFHDINAYARLLPKFAERLNAFKSEICDNTWVLGNHDPDIPLAVNGAREDHVQMGQFLLTHHPHDEPAGFNICGHYHPKAKISSRAGFVTAPCFAIDDNRIIMPSFGTHTGGLYINNPTLKAAMPDLTMVVMAYEGRLFPLKANRFSS